MAVDLPPYDFATHWMPEETIQAQNPVAQRRMRLAKEITRLHWDLIRDDARAEDISAAGYAAADLILKKQQETENT